MELQWPLIIFTTFIVLSAGTFGSVAIISLKEKYEQIQLPGLIIAFSALVIGGIASVLHLQTPERYFGQFGNIASGINQEIIMMALVGIMMVIYFILLKQRGNVNKAVKLISAVLSFFLVLVMAHSYMMAAIPAWNTILLPVYYLINALLLGVLVIVMLRTITQSDFTQNSKLSTVAFVVLGVFALSVVAYVLYLTSLSGGVYSEVLYTDISIVPPVDPTTIGNRLIAGDLALIFWGVVIVVGLILPLGALLVARKTAQTNTATLATASAGTGIILVIAGSLAFRVLLYFAGASVFIY